MLTKFLRRTNIPAMTQPHVKHATPEHPILTAIAQRWSPYAYDASRPVEREKLLACLEAARWAASSYNEQPWSFIIATQQQPAEFARMLQCLAEPNQPWARHAPVLMLTVAARNFTRNNKPNRVAEHDVGLAIGNLAIQASALGLQAHQMAGIEPAKIRASYSVPEGYDPVTAVALGYPAATHSDAELLQRDAGARARKKFADFVFAGAWKKPATL